MSTTGISNPTLSTTTTAGHDNMAMTTANNKTMNTIAEQASTISDYANHGVTTSNASNVPEKQPLRKQQQRRVKGGSCFQDIIEQDLMTGLEDSTHRLSISDQHPLEKREM